MPLPFPEVFLADEAAAVPRAWLKRLVCLQVAVMSWLAMGCPPKAPPELCLGVRLRAQQWRIINNLLYLNVDSNTPELVDAQAMGRAASKFEVAEDAIAALARAATALQVEEHSYFGGGLTKPGCTYSRPFRCGLPSGKLNRATVCTAKPIVADRFNFPGPPGFSPCRFFDKVTAERYNKPIELSKSSHEYEDVVPKVKVFADEANKVELYKKLADSGRLLPIPSSYRETTFSPACFLLRKTLQETGWCWMADLLICWKNRKVSGVKVWPLLQYFLCCG